MKESLEKTKDTQIVRFEKNKTIFLMCNCKSEILFIEHDFEHGLTELSLYENMSSYKHKMSFWQKIRYIYKVLADNSPYIDQIILDKNQLKKLSDFINSLI